MFCSAVTWRPALLLRCLKLGLFLSLWPGLVSLEAALCPCSLLGCALAPTPSLVTWAWWVPAGWRLAPPQGCAGFLMIPAVLLLFSVLSSTPVRLLLTASVEPLLLFILSVPLSNCFSCRVLGDFLDFIFQMFCGPFIPHRVRFSYPYLTFSYHLVIISGHLLRGH